MLLNLFGKKEESENDAIFKDKVFINTEGKMNACLRLAIDKPNVVFIGWFTATVLEYKTFFTVNNIAESRVIAAGTASVELLNEYQPIFLEHHPMNAKELELTADWPNKGMIVLSAMDEPLFKHFGSDKMIPIIKLFGMKESEPIEHSYVTESIIKGQNKIAFKVIKEQPANSQAEWMQLNMEA